MKDQFKVGIVLSGGGIRGIAHLGVLKALKDAGIKFSHVSGTSAGSIVGALISEGHDPQDILKVFMQTRLLKFIRASIGASGLLSIENTSKLLGELIPHNSFEGLKNSLTIAATNFSKGTLRYFSAGELIPAIQASCAIPGVFKPLMIDKQMYVDGGVLNNFPVEPLRSHCDFIIGSSCNHLPVVDKITNFKKLIERAAIMSVNADMEAKYACCNVVIEPKGMGETSIFDVAKTEQIYWLGYDCALKMLQTDPALINLTQGKLKIA